MEEDSIRQKIEEVDPEGKIPSDVVDDLVFSVVEKDKDDVPNESDNVEELRDKIEETDDWREKAKISAKIISKGLDY